MKKTAFGGLTLALALIASYVESLIPIPIPIPGIKLGVANSVILILLYKASAKDAFIVNIIRVVLSGFMFGNLFSIWYSLSGAVVSLLMMVFVKKTERFTETGVSIAGGVMHNMGQLVVAWLVLESVSVWYYLPVLMLAGCFTGFVIGILAEEINKRIQFPKD